MLQLLLQAASSKPEVVIEGRLPLTGPMRRDIAKHIELNIGSSRPQLTLLARHGFCFDMGPLGHI